MPAAARPGIVNDCMALATGTRLGPYTIESLLGAGGMGEVYRATDGRLDRTVAIKVLPAHLSNSPKFKQRFDREARIISQLAHPHLCALFDLGQQDDIAYFVMELLEGETLAARLKRGPLPPADVRRFGAQIADALESAHRHDVIHRDLKPANVMLTRTGVKLLDFGIAKPLATGDAAADSTRALPQLTAEGTAPGTLQYMAPEQIEGKPVTPRTDIFSLGSVIYEMATGRPAFTGSSRTVVIAAILEHEPEPMSALAPASAGVLETIVSTCLKKEPLDRWQSAHDVAIQLRSIPDTGAATVQVAGPGRGRSLASIPALALVAAIALAAAGAGWAIATVRGGHQLAGTPTREVRATLTLAADAPIAGAQIVFTPDGSTVVYGSARGGQTMLVRRGLADADSSPIDGTLGADEPFLSPDGQWVAFYDGKQLMKVPIGGGRPTAIAAFASVAGASWGDDGFIVVGTRQETGLFRVSADGGTPEPLTVPTAEDAGNDHRWPQALPGGRGILFSVGTGPEESARIVVLDRHTGVRKDLLRGSASARYVATGHLVYARDAELFAMPFDLERLETTGAQVRVATGVNEGTDGAPEYAFSRSGDLVHASGWSGGPRNALMLVDRQGRMEETRFPKGPILSPRISPDGGRVAITVGGAKNNIWVYDILRGAATRVTFGRYHSPFWTPDGHLTFSKGPPDRLQLVRRSTDDTGPDEELTSAGPLQFGGSWTPDGQTLIYERFDPRSRWDLWTVTPGRAAPAPLVASSFSERSSRLSPDGRWLAYSSDENGRFEVYVRAMAGGRRWPVSVDGGGFAVWSPDGKQLYFRAGDGGLERFWVVDVTLSAAAFSTSRPRRLFDPGAAAGPNPLVGAVFDVMPGGDRFVMTRLGETAPKDRLQLALGALTPSASAR